MGIRKCELGIGIIVRNYSLWNEWILIIEIIVLSSSFSFVSSFPKLSTLHSGITFIMYAQGQQIGKHNK